MEALVRPWGPQLGSASRRVLVLLITLCCISSLWSSTLAKAPDTSPARSEDANLYDNATLVVQNPTDRPVVLQSLFNVALDTIVFQVPSFTLLPAAWTYVSADTPYVLDRNFSILSQQAPPTVMDWSFLDRKVVMKPGTTFIMDNLVLMNTRKLDTFYFNWFVNSPGAVLTIYNSILLDPVCNATASAEDLQSAQALPQVPQERRNLVSTAPPFCLQLPSGTECFEQGVLMHALTVVVASASRLNRNIATTPAQAAAAAAAGNFVIQLRNTTRVCRRFLDPQCLQELVGNRTACWEQAAAPPVASGTTRSSMSPGTIAGAVIGGVVGLLLVLAAVLLLLGRRRHKHSYAGSGSLDSKANLSSFPDPLGPQLDAHQSKPSLDSMRMGKGLLEDTSARGFLVQGSGRLSMGDQNVRASFGRDGLHLGPLLGAGSYGRVYKGRWHGQDVAIKIIHCLPEELQRVLREAEITLQLDHPNVVRALNCILQHKPGGKADAQHNSGSLSDSYRSQARHSSGGGGSSGSSRKPSTSNSISQMLPVLRKTGSANSSGSKPQSPPAGAGTMLGSLEAGSTASAARQGLPDSAAAAADQQLVLKQQHQQGHGAVQQQELHVLPVLTTGSEVAGTSGSTPDRAFVQHQQQRQRQGLDPELAEENGQEEVAEVWLVLELCTGGSLQDSFRQRNDAFDLARLLCRLAEVAQGMAYLHSRQIMHGDLKSANVLLVNSIHGSFGQIAKLTDFGLAGVLGDGLTHNSTQHLGTISHCAPEVLQNGHVSPAADVYAFGIMMWELYTSTTAFKDLHYGTIIQRVVLGGHRPPIPPDCPEDYALLMESCWNTNPAERPTFEQIMECLTIMIHSLDAVTCTSPTGNVLTRSPRPSIEKAGGATGADRPEADVPPLSNSRKVGSFDMCRASSGASSQLANSQLAASTSLGTSSNVGLFKLQQAASASSADCRSASAAAAAAPVTGLAAGAWPAAAAATGGGSGGGAGNGGQGAGVGGQQNMGTWYVRKEPAAVAAGTAAAGAGAGGNAAVGSPAVDSADVHIGQVHRRVVPGNSAFLGVLAEQDSAAAQDQRASAQLAAAGSGSGSGGSGGRVQHVHAAMQGHLAAATAAGAGGAVVPGAVHTGGSANSSASAGSSKLSQSQPPQSRHIQDLW